MGEYSRMAKKAPSIGQWLKIVWIDFLTLAVLAGLTLFLWISPPLYPTLFPMSCAGSTIYVDPSLAYPLVPQTIKAHTTALASILVPIAVILAFQIKVQSFWDAHNGIFGVLHAIGFGALVHQWLTFCFGGLRPNFFDACQPRAERMNGTGVGFGNMIYDKSVCGKRDWPVVDAFKSFPSGHVFAAFVGAVFLFHYLNGKLNIIPGDGRPRYWALFVCLFPLLAATMQAGASLADYHHHWYDILTSVILAPIVASLVYRMNYGSLWDTRTNHMPRLSTRLLASSAERGEGAGEASSMTTVNS